MRKFILQLKCSDDVWTDIAEYASFELALSDIRKRPLCIAITKYRFRIVEQLAVNTASYVEPKL